MSSRAPLTRQVLKKHGQKDLITVKLFHTECLWTILHNFLGRVRSESSPDTPCKARRHDRGDGCRRYLLIASIHGIHEPFRLERMSSRLVSSLPATLKVGLRKSLSSPAQFEDPSGSNGWGATFPAPMRLIEAQSGSAGAPCQIELPSSVGEEITFTRPFPFVSPAIFSSSRPLPNNVRNQNEKVPRTHSHGCRCPVMVASPCEGFQRFI